MMRGMNGIKERSEEEGMRGRKNERINKEIQQHERIKSPEIQYWAKIKEILNTENGSKKNKWQKIWDK